MVVKSVYFEGQGVGVEMKEGEKHSVGSRESIDNTRHWFSLQVPMKQVKELQTQLEEAKTQAATLRAQVEEAQTQAATLRAQVEEAQKKAATLQAQVVAAQTQAATLQTQVEEEVPSITSIVVVLTTLALVILAKANILTMPIAAGLIGLAIMCDTLYDKYAKTSKLAAVKGCVKNHVVAVNLDKPAAQSLHSPPPAQHQSQPAHPGHSA